MHSRHFQRLVRFDAVAACAWLMQSALAQAPEKTPSTLAPASTPAHQIFDLSIVVISITGGIFLVVGGLLAVTLIRFRARKSDPYAEPAQIYGSTQIELAWTDLPVLIVVVLFLTTALQAGGNMPAYGKNLSPPEVTALVSFLETLHPANELPAADAFRNAAMLVAHPSP